MLVPTCRYSVDEWKRGRALVYSRGRCAERGRVLCFCPSLLIGRPLINSDDQSRPLVILVGGDEARQASLGRLCAAEGWRFYAQSALRPLTNVSLWAEASLVVLVSEHKAHTLPLLDMLSQVGYTGPFVLLARGLSLVTRRYAYLQGARDVMRLPAEARHIEARLHAVLYVINTCAAPPRALPRAPEHTA